MKKQDRTLLYLMMIGLSILLIMRDIYGVSLSKFIYFCFVAAFMVAANYQTLVQMVCFILPLVCGLPATYIMLVILALLIVKRKTIKMIQFLPLFLLLLLELFAAMWYPSLQLSTIVQYISFAGVMIFLINDDKELDHLQCVRLYVLGTLLVCGVIVYATLKGAPDNWTKLFSEGQFRFGNEHVDEAKMHLTMNANSLAYYSLVGMACCLLLVDKTDRMKKIWYIALASFFVVVGFLSLSRSWLLMAAICLLLYIMSKLRSPKQFITLFVVLAILIGVATVYLNQNPELVSGFETRFNDESMESGGNRTNIFRKYMEVFFANPRFVFLGAGVTQTNIAVGSEGSMHNGLQQILVCCGSLGFLLYMYVLGTPVLKACSKRKVPLVYWLPLLSVVAFTQTIQFLNPMMLMLPYAIGVYSLKCAKDSGTSGT